MSTQRYADPVARQRMAAGTCPECGDPVSAHNGRGGSGCSLTDNGAAARIARYQAEQADPAPAASWDMTITPSPAPVHEYCFEIWPDPLPPASYPLLLPRRVTVRTGSYDDALALAAQGLAIGQTLGACSHWRSRCVPPHPGRG